MTTRNDITGDKIQSRSTKITQENWESIFGTSRYDRWMEEKKIEELKYKENKPKEG